MTTTARLQAYGRAIIQCMEEGYSVRIYKHRTRADYSVQGEGSQTPRDFEHVATVERQPDGCRVVMNSDR